MANADFILGNTALHERVRSLTAVLGKFVASAPRALSVRQLHEHTGLPEKELAKLCRGLLRAALLRPVQPSAWALACAASDITLEDVVRCAIAEQPVRAKASPQTSSKAGEDGISRDVDLLVMQATVSINQSVCQHLRKFPLDRLNFGAAAAPPQRKDAGRLYFNENPGRQTAPLSFS